MKINKLKLKNFRSYEDETTFDFSTTKDKNIILVGGKNGAGKSTIFEAIKLCIYGPTAYKYQGFNSNYITKVKSNINNNSLKNSNINAFISVDIEINEQTEKNIYTLTRNWTFKDTKLDENFYVYKNFSPIPLVNEELNYFENYITSIISPKIFEFFFFDGEHLSEFFIGKNSNVHLKQSLLSLCNFDTFDVLRNTIMHTNRSNKKNKNEIETSKEAYLSFDEILTTILYSESTLNIELQDINNEIEDLKESKNKLDKDFRKKGGLLANERDSLNNRTIQLETRRSVINQNIKDFCNELLPFLIIKKQVIDLQNQINTESDNLLYSNLKSKLNFEYIRNILNNKVFDNSLDKIALTISDALIEDIKPDNYVEDFTPIHNLSSENSSTLTSLIDTIVNYNTDTIINLFKEYDDIAIEVSQIRSKLNESLENDSMNEYIKELSLISNKLGVLEESQSNIIDSLEELKIKIDLATNDRDKAKNKYLELLQFNKVTDMSDNIVLMLEDIISNLTKNKTQEIQNNFMSIFTKIIQKDNFIDFIDIDDDFNTSLYINKSYSSLELENLIDNIGFDDIDKKFGELFIEDLFNIYKANNKIDLINNIKSIPQSNFLNLRTKIDINGFSSGEKQIYILCLYWALIKSSGIEIPFIIDTPYARIDETHRNNITNEYLSTISNQVIILSTNTEINESAYKDIKPKLNGEYLIEYDDKNRRTIQSEGYFFEV